MSVHFRNYLMWSDDIWLWLVSPILTEHAELNPTITAGAVIIIMNPCIAA